MASRLTSFVSNYLYEQRIRQDSLSVERLASTVAPLFQSAQSEMMASLQEVQRELMFLFMAIAVSAMAAALVLSSLLTRPITALTRTIQKMGRGDLSVRARVSGSAEMRHLAESYNTMAEQLEHLDQTRNQFVSNASHELKTP